MTSKNFFYFFDYYTTYFCSSIPILNASAFFIKYNIVLFYNKRNYFNSDVMNGLDGGGSSGGDILPPGIGAYPGFPGSTSGKFRR